MQKQFRILVYMGGTYTVLAQGTEAELAIVLEQIADEMQITKRGNDYIAVPLRGKVRA